MNWISEAINFVITSLGYTPTPRRETTVVIVAVVALVGIAVLGLTLLTQGKKTMLRALLGGVGGAAIGSLGALFNDSLGTAGIAKSGAIYGVLGMVVLALWTRWREGARRASTQRP